MAREAADLYLVNENFYLTGLGYDETRCDVMRRDETRRDETRRGEARRDEARQNNLLS